jgi:putative transcriptional regulator
MSRAGDRILRSVRQARAFARGEATEGFVVHVPEAVDVKAIRSKIGMSQEGFALRYGFSPAAVRDWEQHRRMPEAAARVLLTVIEHDPEAVKKALEAKAAHQTADRPKTQKPSRRVFA